MSNYDVEDAMEEFEDAECLYGFEFCSDPQTRALGLCTTECEAYLNAIEEISDDE